MSDEQKGPSIDVGADVVAQNGDHLGKVGYVVVRPPEFRVTDVVVTTGVLLGRDIVVPVDRIARVEDGTVQLALNKWELDAMDDYVEAHYDRPPDDWYATTGMYYPGSATLWPTGSYYPVPTSVQVNAPAGTVGLREGMEVVSNDGHKVGTIDSIRVGGASGDVTAIFVKHGFILTHDTEFPISDVRDVNDERVVLGLSRDEVKIRSGD